MTDALKELEPLLAERERRRAENRLAYYEPYPKQAEFHALGATKRERALIAGNQVGKTYCAAAEVAMHLTGRYPEWWNGHRFTKPILAWALGITQTSTRDTGQLQLLGPAGDFGTGFLPRETIDGVRMGRGISDSVDVATILHKTGGVSRVVLKAYQMGRLALQGPSVDLIWPDEEPDDYELYSELLARMAARPEARLLATFTPLLGQTRIVQRFMGESNPSRGYVTMTLADAAHIALDDRAKREADYPDHERDARVRGIPLLGSGRIFSIPESAFVIPGFAIPSHWARLAAMDRGKGGHLTAVIFLAHDRDSDVVYIHDIVTFAGNTPLPVIASAIRQRGPTVPVAWPRDLSEADPQSGRPIAELFRNENVKMLPEPAQFEDGSVSVEAGLMVMQSRIEAGTFKIFESCAEPFLSEYRTYHRKAGRIVKEQDDVLDAARYGLMMLRKARAAGATWDSRVGRWFDPDTGRHVARNPKIKIADGVENYDPFNPTGRDGGCW